MDVIPIAPSETMTISIDLSSLWQPIETAPENEWIILGSCKPEIVTFGVKIDGRCINADLGYFCIEGVTHWMPIPPPPKGG